MPTAEQREAVRYPLAANSTNLPDAELDPLFTRAAVKYPSSEDAQIAWVGLQVVRNLRSQAVKRTHYKQNQSEEWLEVIFPRLKELQADYEEELEYALEGNSSLARMSRINRIAPPIVEVPHGAALLTDSDQYPFNTDTSRLTES